MRGLQRSRQERYRTSSVYVSAATGTDESKGILVTPPDAQAILLRLRMAMEDDYTANASNYWTIALQQKELDGTALVQMYSKDFDVIDLSSGSVFTLPEVGEFQEGVPPDRNVVLTVTETGTGTDTLTATFHLDWMLGG